MPIPIHEVLNTRLGGLHIRLIDFDERGVRIIACSFADWDRVPKGGPSDRIFRVRTDGTVWEESRYETLSDAQVVEAAIARISGFGVEADAELIRELRSRLLAPIPPR